MKRSLDVVDLSEKGQFQVMGVELHSELLPQGKMFVLFKVLKQYKRVLHSVTFDAGSERRHVLSLSLSNPNTFSVWIDPNDLVKTEALKMKSTWMTRRFKERHRCNYDDKHFWDTHLDSIQFQIDRKKTGLLEIPSQKSIRVHLAIIDDSLFDMDRPLSVSTDKMMVWKSWGDTIPCTARNRVRNSARENKTYVRTYLSLVPGSKVNVFLDKENSAWKQSILDLPKQDEDWDSYPAKAHHNHFYRLNGQK